jgi:mRNA-degrading endonuclease RelE of RelBE toxin-antitoxin system
MYIVIQTNEYEKEINKWDKKDREAVNKISSQLAENPYIGDQVSYPFLEPRGPRR